MYVEYEPDGHLVTIRLNRPERRNSMSQALMKDLAAAWERFAADERAWVAILTGTGAAFCAGADLKEAAQGPVAAPPIPYPFVPPTDKPTISAVNGVAIGGGLIMAASCDFGVVAENATLRLAEVQLGRLGGWDLGQRLRLPVHIQNELSLLAANLTGKRAVELGIFNRAVPADQVIPAAREIADRLLSFPPQAVREMKRLMNMERVKPADATWDAYLAARDRLTKSEDNAEAVRAFNEKRPPKFTGR